MIGHGTHGPSQPEEGYRKEPTEGAASKRNAQGEQLFSRQPAV